MQVARLNAVLAAKREQHPELRRPLTSGAMRAVLRREKIAIHAMPHPRDAELTVIAGQWVLIINDEQSSPAQLIAGAHEVAHLWAHRDPFFDRSETVFDRSPDWYDAQHEREAEYVAEQLIAGPVTVVGKSKPVRKTRRQSAASNVPLATRKAPPRLPLPDWLEDVERDADAVRLVEHARNAQRAYAREYPAPTGPTIQFAIDEAAWQAVHFSPGDAPHYRRTTAVPSGTTFVIVTCTPAVASRVVASLARAGYKRTAVYVRRTIREAADSYEVREQHRAHVIREGAKRVAASSETWVTKARKDE
jgi:hypothetical protein